MEAIKEKGISSVRQVVIDCDTGVDDALALLLALRSPQLQVIGVTTVAGNVTIDKVSRNTLVVVEHSGKQVPVLRGASKPLIGSWETGEHIHGRDGLGDLNFPEPKGSISNEHAVDFIIRTFKQKPMHMITLGPLTNLALALALEPKLEEHILSLVMMAGGITGGNRTPAAEFNVWADPEAADVVFRSRIPKTMVALEPIDEGAKLWPEDAKRLGDKDTPWCWMAGQLLQWQLEHWGSPVTPPDPAAVAVAIMPTIAETRMYHVAIETRGTYTKGMTVVDRRQYRDRFPDAPAPNINVVTHIDNTRYRNLVMDTWLRH